MSYLNFIVDYNPIALTINKIFQKIQLFSDLSNYFRSLLGDNIPPLLQKWFFAIGVVSMTYFVAKRLYLVYKMWGWVIPHYVNISNYNEKNFQQKYGKCWVMVTGFTEGIGWQYAQQFARMKFNLVLVGRNKEKIQKCLQYLKEYYPNVLVQVIQVDASIDKDGENLKKQIANISESKDIGILVNNVALAPHGNFFQIDKKMILDTIKVNARFTFQLTQQMLPIFRKRQHKSAIINIASYAGVFMSPWLASYPASKKLLDVYSRTISIQNKDKIDIISSRPFGVTTKMMKMKKGPMMITPEECVMGTLYDLSKCPTSYGHFKHKLSGAYFSTLSQKQTFKQNEIYFRPKK